MTNHDEEQEEPLDPKLEYIRRRMIRLLLVSIGILFAGLIAVFAAIIYRINEDDPSKKQGPVSEIPGDYAGPDAVSLLKELDLSGPPNARLMTVELDGDRLMLSWELSNSGNQIWIVSLETGEILSRISID